MAAAAPALARSSNCARPGRTPHFWNWCTGSTAKPRASCWWPKSAPRSRICKRSCARARPARPIWHWGRGAKKGCGLRHLQAQLRARTTGKTYLALVAGAWPAHQRVIDLPLHKYLQADGERRVRVTTADDPHGMRSIPLVRPRGSWPARAGLPALQLLEVTIKTGRTHQIRVHLASQGHAIAGDDKYGDFELNKRMQKQGLKRMILDGLRLQFKHPASGEPVALHAELAPELADLVNPP